MDYLTLKGRIKRYYPMKMMLAYLFNKKQTSKQNILLHPCKLSAGSERHRWLSVAHMIIFQRCHK